RRCSPHDRYIVPDNHRPSATQPIDLNRCCVSEREQRMRETMKWIAALLLVGAAAGIARAEDAPHKRVKLFCHRTANEDVPENTLESLKQAALLGCDVVEIDLRRTLDGKIVLNHDGVLERLTDGIGETE